ncbi:MULTISPECIES: TIGR01440 family protein [unclassified Bacillus (in: firmicutes)]|uniref:TIGR01440 family protein n=1 Tax=unclassified Bacillus (in: firmicutes) TaxID=185979 RepID=UPI0004027AA2|nr:MULTISPECIES: TIGR01440 family protein [unclassified Bacillus (in: firmicutes)]PGZ94629.1 TIGR01440 family protein [Bacillus sp. AFS029533]SFD63477.1 TIGR01440 family protein [Bacillus sp. UNCCL81]
MNEELKLVAGQIKTLLNELNDHVSFTSDHVLVIGCSTSEVSGQRIGTSGTIEVAEVLFNEIKAFQDETGVQLAFQCCEHLNRAIVVQRKTAKSLQLDEVTVIPVRTAGGALASYAFRHIDDAVIVEHIKADAGIDIGDTLIGMHLKHVAVPLRTSIKQVGQAHITAAKTRPKLIGGARAVYSIDEDVK